MEHAVVRRRPESRQLKLYVTPMVTQRIIGLRPRESHALLQFLYHHIALPDFQCRFRWRPNSVAMWDNRCTQHLALWDYDPETRAGYRATLAAT